VTEAARHLNRAPEFRLAAATTSAFTALTGGTQQSAMAFLAGHVNRLSAVYERDLSVRCDLVAGIEKLIFLTKPDGSTDADPDRPLDENQAKADAFVWTDHYDLGMVFATNDPGRSNGVAQLRSDCEPGSKARNSQRVPSADGAFLATGGDWSVRPWGSEDAPRPGLSPAGSHPRHVRLSLAVLLR
jgi:hypothetical protein